MNEQLMDRAKTLTDMLEAPPHFLFFTGKGGVGKTTIACATAVALADRGKKVLLISTDPASNLDEVLGVELSREPRQISGCDQLWALNIDPEEVAAIYREKVIGPMRGVLPEAALRAMEEQLSGACTMEIAAFDEFTAYLTGAADEYQAIIFDTAPTGHTLRLMALSQAWTNFLQENRSGNSCLGPLAGLAKQQQIYLQAVEVLRDAARTAVYLVTRPQRSPLKEAYRTWQELKELGFSHQSLIINGWLETETGDDRLAKVWQERQNQAIKEWENFLRSIPLWKAPLFPDQLVGLERLRFFYSPDGSQGDAGLARVSQTANLGWKERSPFGHLDELVDQLARERRGVIMTMGKGGVGKTTLAAAIAVGLADRGVQVCLSTTDPAAHLNDALGHETDLPLRVERIDPKAETAAYVQEVLATQGAQLDSQNLALLEEDLRSPCTEEVAVFRAFARTVARGEHETVVLDTAPTGHTLLLLDATQSYHRELGRQSRGVAPSDEVSQLLPRLRDPAFTRILLVTVPESTPVHEAAALQADLQRAQIGVYAWLVNQCLVGVQTSHPLLIARQKAQEPWLREVAEVHATNRPYLIAWNMKEPSGLAGLRQLLKGDLSGSVAGSHEPEAEVFSNDFTQNQKRGN